MLILMTHGNFAEGILHSARMIVGDMVNRTYAIGVQPEMDPEAVMETFKETASNLEPGEKLYVMVDIMSGTPCNVAMRLIQDYADYTVVSGLNLATLLEFLTNEGVVEESERMQTAIEEGKRQLTDVSELFRQRINKNKAASDPE